MPYRSLTSTKPRSLEVRNEPVATAMVATSGGFLFALAGCLLLPMTNLFVPPPGGEVVMSAMATVFLIAGACTAVMGIRMHRSRSRLALERHELSVTMRTRGGSMVRHVVHVDEIERVGLEVDHHGHGHGQGTTYRTQIVVRGGTAIALGEGRTLSRRHCERVAEDIVRFLGWR